MGLLSTTHELTLIKTSLCVHLYGFIQTKEPSLLHMCAHHQIVCVCVCVCVRVCVCERVCVCVCAQQPQ